MKHPLEGLKVLDLSRILAGPFAGRMLSDLGADVVKVEPPEGDMTRYWGKEVGNMAGYYQQQNAGKRNICIDLRADGASELVKQLVAETDILVENYRPGVMSRLGINYEVLKQVNPGLVMLSISGFGQQGPESERAAFAPVVHAESGLLHRMTTRNQMNYHDLPTSVADTNAGLHGLVGILSAIIMRSTTGLGQHIDIAMIDCAVATDDQLHYDLEDSWETGPLGVVFVETSFGPVLLSTDFRLFFRLLVSEFGVEDPATADMALPDKIQLRQQAIDQFIAGLNSRSEFEQAMKKINIPWGDVREPDSVPAQSSIEARGMIAHVDDRHGGTRPITQSPYHFSNASSGVRGPAPHRGEHNSSVLNEWLEIPEDEVAALLEQGVLIYDADWQHH
jgi:CoA:oxalate CoA-transferase